jgi:DNA-binding MarR family transcriptional regulator
LTTLPRDDDVNLAVLLEAVDGLLVRQLHADLDANGHGAIRPAHGVVFEHIGQDGARLTDLADRAGISKQSMGYLVDHLVEHGYCERAADAGDGRAKIVRLTDLGWRAVQVAERSLRTTEERWEEQHGTRAIAALRKTLTAIIAGER